MRPCAVCLLNHTMWFHFLNVVQWLTSSICFPIAANALQILSLLPVMVTSLRRRERGERREGGREVHDCSSGDKRMTDLSDDVLLEILILAPLCGGKGQSDIPTPHNCTYKCYHN